MRLAYRGEVCTINQLSEMSGIAPATIRDRIRRGYTVEEAVKDAITHDSVREFDAASHWEDWIGMSTSELHEIYWRWCVSNGYTPLQSRGFTRHLVKIHPIFKVISTKTPTGYARILRLREEVPNLM